MTPLSAWARRGKTQHLLSHIRAGHRVLEVGAGDGWVAPIVRERGGAYTSVDLQPPADIVGDIREWRALGLRAASFDVVIAFELLEHVPCADALHALLGRGGLLLATTPWPDADALCRALELAKLSQSRTSPHDFLVRLDTLPGFEVVDLRRPAGLAQWGVLRKRN